MKILAIRGKNLASLAGEFTVDFEQEPLKSAGLFAISGPTGAGKSTLLDALCMALYESTPRLIKAGGAKTLPDGTDLITHQDAANLLRRGCAEGYAEVDFVGNDGAAYRSRWSVRRARGSIKGSLQASTMSLLQLPALQPIGGKKNEVKAEIIQRIGLSFEQFTRAVLLAQNEFSSFLKADDNERGELLETLTGSTIYSELSKRAFARAKLELQALQRINDRLADQKPLDAETRAALEIESQTAQQNLTVLNQQLADLNSAIRWHTEAEKISQTVQAAHSAVEEHRAINAQANPRRENLQQLEALQAARPLLTELDRSNHALAQTAAAITQSQAQLASASAANTTANAALLNAQAQQHIAEQAQSAAAPQLDAAKKLDASLEARLPALTAQQAALAQANLALNACKQQHTQQQEKLNHGYTQLDHIDKWLQGNTHDKNLSQNWPAYEVLLQQAALAHRAAQQAAEQDAQLAQQASASNELANQASTQLAQAEATQQAAEQQRHAAIQQFTQIDISALPAEKAHCTTRREHLSSAQSALQRLTEHAAQAAKLSTQQQDNQQNQQRATLALAQTSAQLPLLIAAQTQAERSLKLAEAACNENVESLREALLPDAPCPVCGALDHPYAHNNPPLQSLLIGLQTEVAQCRQQQQQCLNQQTSAEAEINNLQRSAQIIAAELATIHSNLASANTQWAAHPLYAEIQQINHISPIESIDSWFASQTAALQSQIVAIAAKEQAWQTALQTKDAAQVAFELANSTLQTSQAAVQTQQTALGQISNQRSAAQAAQQQETQRIADYLAQLAPALSHLPDWQTAWANNPAAMQAQWQARAQTWLAQHSAHATGQQETQLLAQTVAALAESAQKAAQEQQRISQQTQAEQAAMTALRTERQALFAGQAVQTLEAQLAQAISSARTAQTQAQQAAHKASQNATGAQAALTQAQQQQSQHQAAQLAAQQALDSWLSQQSVTPPLMSTASETSEIAETVPALNEATLRQHLAFDAAWLAQERSALLAIDSALAQAKTILQERIAQQQNHASQRPSACDSATSQALAEHQTADLATASQPDLLTALQPDLTPQPPELTQAAPPTLEQLASQAAQTSIDQQVAQSAATALQLQIAQDEARRRSASDLLQEIAAQETQQRRWAQLGDLIGSADGKKFRNYAQQYTLDVLLAYTNRHLQQLSRRYRLQRIADTLAMMVIDQDMGDEARSVHSLSGGESFLVSLALALGLASLSSNRVRVESLFIDEGFGSLDAETLRVAMDALDGLQAMGRKVGVISHVQEMTERIATKILVQKVAGGRSLVGVF